jgi:hypothetical protein
MRKTDRSVLCVLLAHAWTAFEGPFPPMSRETLTKAGAISWALVHCHVTLVSKRLSRNSSILGKFYFDMCVVAFRIGSLCMDEALISLLLEVRQLSAGGFLG